MTCFGMSLDKRHPFAVRNKFSLDNNDSRKRSWDAIEIRFSRAYANDYFINTSIKNQLDCARACVCVLLLFALSMMSVIVFSFDQLMSSWVFDKRFTFTRLSLSLISYYDYDFVVLLLLFYSHRCERHAKIMLASNTNSLMSTPLLCFVT